MTAHLLMNGPLGAVQVWPLAALASPALLYAGLAAAAVPILIHLLNRRRFRRVRWAAMDFLIQADRRNRRRIRIEEFILLALRCLAMGLIGLALARWFIQPESLAAALGSRGRGERIVLLDDSFSMALRDGTAGGDRTASACVFEQAKQTTAQLVRSWRDSSPDDRLTLILTSRPDDPILTGIRLGELDLGVFKATFENLRVSNRPARFPAAMAAVHRRLDALPAGASAALYVVSDFQRIDWLADESATGVAPAGPAAALADWADRNNLRLVLVNVGASASQNLAVVDLQPQQSQAVATIEGRFVARVENFGAARSAATSLRAYVGDAALPPASVPAIEPGRTADIALDATFSAEGTDVLTVELPPDALPVDNAQRLTVPVARALRILVVNGERSPDPYEDETFLLAVALQPEGPQFSGNEVTIIDENELDAVGLEDYPVVVLANVYHVSPTAAERLEAFVAAGGGLAVFLGDQVDAEACNRLLYRDGRGLLPARLGERVAGPGDSPGWPIGDVRPDHPLTRRFAGDNASLFQLVRVRQFLRAEPAPGDTQPAVESAVSRPASQPLETQTPPAQVLVRLGNDERDPLLLEKTFGRGRVVLFTSSADKEWNNLADQPIYVVLAMEMAQHLARRSTEGGRQLVGSPIRLPFDTDRFLPVAWIKPPSFPADPATRIEPQPDPQAGQTLLTWPHTDEPGVYRFELTEITGKTVSLPVAVNVDTRESDLRLADEAALRASMPPDLHVDYVTGRDLAARREVQVRRELWPAVLIVLAAVLMVEQFLGWYFGSGRNLALLWRSTKR